MTTVGAALAHWSAALAKSSPTPRPDAQILLAHALHREREWLIAHAETPLNEEALGTYARLCEKRVSGMPVAYITGHAGFYGRDFVVNENVLIPRPETEHLVEDALAYLREKIDPRASARQTLTVFEAGAGSGAVACTIAAEIPQALIEGSDISAAALEVARENARRLHVQERCRFYLADIVPPGTREGYDVILANLPYIPSAQIPRVPDPVAFEPHAALDGGPDGLSTYRKLLAAAPKLLRPGSLLLMEAAPPTIGALAELTRAALSGARVEVHPDYAGLDRYVRVVAAGRVAA